MFRVYWTEHNLEKALSNFKDFEINAMSDALQFIEYLRNLQRTGKAIRHVTMSAENPNSAGKAGVADPPANYEWKKRRQ